MCMSRSAAEQKHNTVGGKVGILTFPNATSHGAILQMYALYKTVEDLGYDAEIINYQNAYMKHGKHTHLNAGANQLVNLARSCARRLLHLGLYQRFRRFEKKLHHYPARPFDEKCDFAKLQGRYDSVICGSDQVWNPEITGSDLSFFLDFCGEKTKRIAYAPSFGVETLSEEFSHAAASEMDRFAALSVREAQGAEMAEKLVNRPVMTVIDPTFLIPAQQWHAIEETVCCEEPYILYYSLRHSDSLWSFCKELAKVKKMKILVVGGNSLKSRLSRGKDVQYAADADPARWLYLISHANYIVTNSFHGTAFSINYRKDFYVEFSSKFNSRLEYLISSLGLSGQVIENGQGKNWGSTDYSQADRALAQLRDESLQYLKNALMKEPASN